MRRTLLTAASLVILIGALARLGGCITLAPPDGALQCSPTGKPCPDGYTCLAPSGTCWRNGSGPDMALPGGTGGNGRCFALARPSSGSVTVALSDAFPGVTFSAPLGIVQAPGDGAHFYVWEQGGQVKRVDATGGAQPSVVVDVGSAIISGGEAGLLGLAFSPSWATNHIAYLSYTGKSTTAAAGFKSVLSRIQSMDSGATFALSSEVPIFGLDQPYTNHNGGNIIFGPDGYLYFGLGDGGSGGDPQNRAQDVNTLFGKMLRLDVENQTTYAIPPTNPFAHGGGKPEIYAWGLRNPWRWSFDRATGELWAGDVGQNAYEEVDKIQLGGNYGWNKCEGSHSYPGGGSCNFPGSILPIVDYPRDDGNVITGGYVYRGTAIPTLIGSYLFADEGSGRLWRIVYGSDGTAQKELLLDTGKNISSFGEGLDGELYAASYGDGKIYKLVASGTTPTNNFPERLSLTGCFQASDLTRPAGGLIAYDVNVPLWSDGADKRRWISLPEGAKIHINDDGDWDLPVGTVLIKEFSIGGKRVETRLLVRHDDGDWAGYSYEWLEDQSEAMLLPSSKTRDVGNGQTWYFPSRTDCLRCHTQAAGRSLGLETAQMNRDAPDGSGNQLAALETLGVFDAPLPPPPAVLPAFPRVDDTAAPADQRARAYLHANCSFCHRMGGPGRVPPDWRFGQSLAQTGACNATPQDGDLGVTGAKLIAPGAPGQSVTSLRMKALDAYRMPPLATHVVDPVGTGLVDAWIMSLTSCN